MEETKDFGELLRAFRHAAKLTIEELSEASGISVRAIGNMERGRSRGPHRRTVVALADALDLTDADRDVFATAAEEGRPRSATAGGICELPWATWDFTGRRVELAWLEDLAGQSAGEGRAVVATISGGPGSGKTALVIQAAEALAGSFPDGRFFIDLRGMDDAPLNPGTALYRLLKAFGVADGRIPRDNEERAAYYRSVLRKQRSLIMLDNAADEAQIRPLLPGGGSSLTLITSRRFLAGLEGVHRRPLMEMPPDDSVQLLRRMIAADHDTDDLETIAGLCGNLPLAMRIAGNRLLSRPTWTARHLARQLADEERRLVELSAGDLHVAAAFAVSYRQLSAGARLLFRRLALVPGPDFGTAMSAVLAETQLDDTEDALEELVELGLLQAPYPDRYRLHDLVRLFARTRLAEEEPQDMREAARERMNDWLLETTIAAGLAFLPNAKDTEPFSSRRLAGEWLERESANWLAAQRDAAEAGQHRSVVELGRALQWFSAYWWLYYPWEEVYKLGVSSSRALADQPHLSLLLNFLGWAQRVLAGRHLADLELALATHEEALAVAVATGDRQDQAWSHFCLGGALRTMGRLESALDHAEKACILARDFDFWTMQLPARGWYGRTLHALGQYEEALSVNRDLLADLNENTETAGVEHHQWALMHVMLDIGRALYGLEQWQKAIEIFRDVRKGLATQGQVQREAECAMYEGVAWREAGEYDHAHECLQHALTVFTDLEARSWRERVLLELGTLSGTFASP